MNYIKQQIQNSILTSERILDDSHLIAQIQSVAELIIKCYKNNNKVLLAGNGGSASDSQHLACELVSKINVERRALSAIALTSNTAILTAISNDLSFELVFSRQIEALGAKNDIFIGFSTSGNSQNIVNAFEQAKSQGLITIAFTGKTPCLLDGLSDYTIKIPSESTPKIQESHMMLGHIICEIIENSFIE